jgi:hypothetical protein
MIDEDERGAVGGVSSRESGSNGRKPAPVPLSPPQIPHDVTWARTPAAEMGSRRITDGHTSKLVFFLIFPCFGLHGHHHFVKILAVRKLKPHKNEAKYFFLLAIRITQIL